MFTNACPAGTKIGHRDERAWTEFARLCNKVFSETNSDLPLDHLIMLCKQSPECLELGLLSKDDWLIHTQIVWAFRRMLDERAGASAILAAGAKRSIAGQS